MEYHAHIYWKNLKERERAMLIREWMGEQDVMLGRIHNVPVGPHPLPMYQVVYDTLTKSKIEKFLELNHDTMSVLLHESINDDYRDHTDGARWLGEALKLDLSIF
jgi:DOPA 4,5-dioxygenase